MDAVSLFLEEELLFRVADKDLSTHRHSLRVGSLVREWAEWMVFRGRWGAVDVDRLALAARLHDLGKIRVPDSVLNKPGALDPLERELMNAHAEDGYRMLEAHPELSYEALAVRHHHERFDGQGYPSGLRGEEIPFQARVVAIVDAFDAMTEDRVYKKGRSEGEAIAELERCAGSHFCPDLTREFVNFIHARNA